MRVGLFYVTCVYISIYQTWYLTSVYSIYGTGIHHKVIYRKYSCILWNSYTTRKNIIVCLLYTVYSKGDSEHELHHCVWIGIYKQLECLALCHIVRSNIHCFICWQQIKLWIVACMCDRVCVSAWLCVYLKTWWLHIKGYATLHGLLVFVHLTCSSRKGLSMNLVGTYWQVA
jgi:hypothetical protein